MDLLIYILSIVVTIMIAYNGEKKYKLTEEKFTENMAIVIATLIVFSVSILLFKYILFNPVLIKC